MKGLLMVLLTLALVAAVPANPKSKDVYPIEVYMLNYGNGKGDALKLEIFKITVDGCTFLVGEGFRETNMVHHPKCKNH